jgi:hypothetical protein
MSSGLSLAQNISLDKGLLVFRLVGRGGSGGLIRDGLRRWHLCRHGPDNPSLYFHQQVRPYDSFVKVSHGHRKRHGEGGPTFQHPVEVL